MKRATVVVAPGASTYRYRAKLKPAGSWRVIVSRVGDGVVDTGSAMASRKFRVK